MNGWKGKPKKNTELEPERCHSAHDDEWKKTEKHMHGNSIVEREKESARGGSLSRIFSCCGFVKENHVGVFASLSFVWFSLKWICIAFEVPFAKWSRFDELLALLLPLWNFARRHFNKAQLDYVLSDTPQPAQKYFLTTGSMCFALPRGRN